MSSNEYKQTGLANNVQFGRGGPRAKVVSGVFQARDSTDSSFAKWQAATPTVGDDLTTKDYVDGLLGALPSLDLYQAAAGASIGLGGAWAAVPMDTQRQIDTAQFTHTTPNAHFTWAGSSGTKVKVEGRFTATSGTAQLVRGRLAINTGAGFNAVPGSMSSEDLISGGEATVEVWAILTLNNGDQIRIEGQGNSPLVAPTVVANSSGLEGMSLINAASGGGGGGLQFTTTKTAAYTATTSEHVRYDPSGGTFTLTMPASPAADAQVGIKNASVGETAITLDGNGNDVEDPAAPGSVAASVGVVGGGISLIYQYDGTQWWIV